MILAILEFLFSVFTFWLGSKNIGVKKKLSAFYFFTSGMFLESAIMNLIDFM